MKRTSAMLMALLLIVQMIPSYVFADADVTVQEAEYVYTVSFDGVEHLFADGSTMEILPEAEERDRQVFVGWYDGDTKIEAPFTPESDMTLKARYVHRGTLIAETEYAELWYTGDTDIPSIAPVDVRLKESGEEPLEANVFIPAPEADVDIEFKVSAHLYTLDGEGAAAGDLGWVEAGTGMTVSAEKARGYCLAQTAQAVPEKEEKLSLTGKSLSGDLALSIEKTDLQPALLTSGGEKVTEYDTLFAASVTVTDGKGTPTREAVSVAYTDGAVIAAAMAGRRIVVLKDGEEIPYEIEKDNLTFTLNGQGDVGIYAFDDIVPWTWGPAGGAGVRPAKAAAKKASDYRMSLSGLMPYDTTASVETPETVIPGEEVLYAAEFALKNAYGYEAVPEHGPIEVTVAGAGIEKAESLHVFRVEGKEIREIGGVKVEGDSVNFETDAAGLYAVTQTIEQTVSIGGATYKITVAYTRDAMIPDGAELDVKEVSGGSYIADTAAALEWSEGDEIFYTKFLDIAIVADGKVIEPQVPVQVTVELLDVEAGAEALEVVHFGEKGAERVNAVADTDGRVTFTADSFSTYGFGSILRTLLSWTSDAVTYTLQGFSALLAPFYTAIKVEVEEGLEALGAYRVDSLLGSILNLIYVKISASVTLTERESVAVYSVVDGEIGELLFEGAESGSIALGGAEGFIVVKDSGFRRRTFDLGNVTLSGMMPKAAEAEASAADADVEGEVLAAFDITIEENGTAYQPDSEHPVEVSIAVGETEGKILRVWHILDDGTREEITEFSVSDEKVSFVAKGFSIYVITDEPGENARIGYRFWYYNGGTGKYEQITTQYFRYKDVQEGGMVIYEPGIPGISQSEFVRIFKGWHKGTVTENSADLEAESLTIADLNSELASMPSNEYVEGTIIDIIAELKDAYYITYVDVNPNSIIATDLVLKEESGTTYFTVKSGIKPTKYEEDLKGWKLLEEIAEDGARMYEANSTYPISENITLAPVIEGGYWLVFDDNDLVDDGTGRMVSCGASYTPSAFYMNNASEQQATVQPPDPEWTGYAFDGWYADAECTIPYVFGEYLTANTTVHAKWVPAESAYTVIIWKQPTDPNATAYDFDQSFSIGVDSNNELDGTIKTGDLVYLDSVYTKIYGEGGTSSDLDKQYFIYNQEKTDQYIIVKANGSSALNVYYDRVPMTITFYTWGNGYVYTETNAEDGVQFGIVDGEYVLLTHIDGDEDVYSYAYSPEYVEVTAGTAATYDRYGIIDGEYKLLDRTANTTYRPYYTYTIATGTNGTQYGVVDGEFEQLSYNSTWTWTGTGYDYTPTTADTGTQYGLVNGEYVQLSKATVYSYNWTRNGNQSYTGDLYPYNSSTPSGYTTSTRFIYPIPNRYYRQNRTGALTATRQGTGTEAWVDSNGAEYTGTRFTRTESTGMHSYEGSTFYYSYYGTYYSISSTNQYFDWYYENYGPFYALVDGQYRQLSRNYSWTVASSGAMFTGNRYTRARNNTGAYTYTGTRYTRSGSSAPYTYTEVITHGGTQYGLATVDNGHVQLETTTSSYTYSYNGDEYTGTMYYVPNQNPVTYTGTIYTCDDGVYHVTTEDAESGRYGKDGNDVFRSLTATVTHPKLWTYEDKNGNTQYYTGTRYTQSASQQNSWQLYKQFVGVYGATLEQYGYEWPIENNWYEYGYGRGGNQNTNQNYNTATTGGSRMTLKTTFEPLEGNLDEKYYGNTPSTSGATISFWLEQLDGTYVQKDEIYLGSNSGSFHINDKYTGFHAVSYSTNGGGSWTNVTPKGTDGYYGSAVSYGNNGLRIRFDRDNYDLVFFPDPDTGAETITYTLPYESPLGAYASQSPGQKEGYYFLGWYADDAHTIPFDFSGIMPDHNVSVYGYWLKERFRVVFVPGADNVYIDPSQGMTFRLDYDEKINGSMVEAATRTGYTLDGWYTDPEFTNKFLFSTPVNTATTGVDMTYQTAAKWNAARTSYGDDDDSHSNVRGIIVLYAKWIVNTSEKGVNIVYDAGSAAQYDGLNNLTTTVPVDPRLYQNGSSVVVGAAPSGYSDLYNFDFWEIVDSQGNVLTVTDGNGNRVSSLSPGMTFNVDSVSDSDAYALTLDENDEVIIKTIKLRAHYTRSEEAAARYTTITYDGDTLNDGVYPSGTKELHGLMSDGSQRMTVTYDEEINATIVLPDENAFYLDGYTMVGWSFFEGTYEEQIASANEWNTQHPDNTVVVQFAPSTLVAADNLKQNDINDEGNTLYAMWQPKTYTVTVKQVVESDVPVKTFTYSYKSGVENALGSATQSVTLTDNDAVTYTNLTTTPSVQYQYYGRLGHVFNIITPTIAESADYAVLVSATVLRDDGTREALLLNELGNYEILGDVEITYTYAMKVPVMLEKRALNDSALLNGSKFVLTPVQWNQETSRWDQVGTATFEYDMSSASSMMRRLQEGVYRVEETQAPYNYAMMGEPLLLTVRRNEAFVIRTTRGTAVSENIAKLSGTDSHTLTVYDRPIRTITVTKQVQGDDLDANGYIITAQFTLEGSPLQNYDTAGNGVAADITNSNGIMQFRLKNYESKVLQIPWGAVMELTENEYVQFTTTTASQQNVADLDTDSGRVYRCTVDVNDTITFTNQNKRLTVTKQVEQGVYQADETFTFTLSGLEGGKSYRLTVNGTAIQRTATPFGYITFDLKHNQIMTIPLVKGSTVTVEEEMTTAQAALYESTVTPADGTVTIAANGENRVTVTNKRKYTLTYKGIWTSGTNFTGEQLHDFGEGVMYTTNPETTLTLLTVNAPEGYIFRGWADSANATTAQYTSDYPYSFKQFLPHSYEYSDKEVYAVYEPLLPIRAYTYSYGDWQNATLVEGSTGYYTAANGNAIATDNASYGLQTLYGTDTPNAAVKALNEASDTIYANARVGSTIITAVKLEGGVWKYTSDGSTWTALEKDEKVDLYYYTPVKVKVYYVTRDEDGTIHQINPAVGQDGTPINLAGRTITQGEEVEIAADYYRVSMSGSMLVVPGASNQQGGLFFYQDGVRLELVGFQYAKEDAATLLTVETDGFNLWNIWDGVAKTELNGPKPASGGETDHVIYVVYEKNTLTIAKTVSGPMGDPNQDFTFTLKTVSGTAQTSFAYQIARKDGTTVSDSLAVNDTFTLKGQESITISFPKGAYIQIEETNDGQFGRYEKTWTNKSGVTGTGSGNTLSVTLNGSSSYTLDNYLPAVSPTGYRTDMTPYLLMLLAGVALLLLRARRAAEKGGGAV
ncbi:MAG: InlB B-repeat-containing protein [Clostridia bacterium]|nr:InlB B-repeat-containing protein [Clostridia bacterium]